MPHGCVIKGTVGFCPRLLGFIKRALLKALMVLNISNFRKICQICTNLFLISKTFL